MITSEDSSIKMTEGDYGITLPILISEQEISSNDKFVIKIFEDINEPPVILKEYSNIVDNTIEFSLSKDESVKLHVGKYFYDIDYCQDDAFLMNVVAKKRFIVEEKAGEVNENRDYT